MPQTEYAIQLEHVTKTFGPVIANHDVTMNIRRGEILSLLGENGSGKTTLMNMIAGIYYPDGGQIIVNGQAQKSGGSRCQSGINQAGQNVAARNVAKVTECH